MYLVISESAETTKLQLNELIKDIFVPCITVYMYKMYMFMYMYCSSGFIRLNHLQVMLNNAFELKINYTCMLEFKNISFMLISWFTNIMYNCTCIHCKPKYLFSFDNDS